LDADLIEGHGLAGLAKDLHQLIHALTPHAGAETPTT
jgi:hypothetical protein